MEKGELFAGWCRVQERGALRRHRDRPNTYGFGFRPAATPFGLEVGWRKLGEGRNSVELELELILSQMAQKPMLRGEVGAQSRP